LNVVFKIKNKKSGTNTKVQGLISKNVESAWTNDIFKLKSCCFFVF